MHRRNPALFFSIPFFFFFSGISSAAIKGKCELLPQRTFRPLSQIRDLTYAQDKIWAATSGGLLVRDLKTGEWLFAWDQRGRLNTTIHQLAYQAPYLWLASDAGLFRLNLNSGAYRLLTTGDGLMATSVRNVSVDNSIICIGYDDDQITFVSPGGKILKSRKLPSGYKSHKLLIDDGFVWLALAGAIGMLDKKTDRLQLWTPELLPELKEINFPPGSYAQWSADSEHVYFSAGSAVPQGKLFRFNKKKKSWSKIADRFTFPIARADDMLWAGAAYGLPQSSRFVLKTIKDSKNSWNEEFFYQSRVLFTSFLPLGDEIWIGLTDGIIRWKSKSKDATLFWPNDPLTENVGLEAGAAVLAGEGTRQNIVALGLSSAEGNFALATKSPDADGVNGLYGMKVLGNGSFSVLPQLFKGGAPAVVALSPGAIWRANAPRHRWHFGEIHSGRVYRYPLALESSRNLDVPYPEELEKMWSEKWDLEKLCFAASGEELWVAARFSADVSRDETAQQSAEQYSSEASGASPGAEVPVGGMWFFNGTDWSEMADEFRDLPGSALLALAADGKNLYAATNDGIYSLNTRGKSKWKKISDDRATHLAATEQKPLRLFAVSAQQSSQGAENRLKVFRVTDEGRAAVLVPSGIVPSAKQHSSGASGVQGNKRRDAGGGKILWESDSLEGIHHLNPYENGVIVVGKKWCGFYRFDKDWEKMLAPVNLLGVCASEKGFVGITNDDIYRINPYAYRPRISLGHLPLEMKYKKISLQEQSEGKTPQLELDR